MMKKIYIEQLEKELFYIGNLDLLNKTKIAIVGSRRPNQYTQIKTKELASKLSSSDVCVVSGCAMGVDAIAHNSAGAFNTIGVVANGLDIRYPAVNKKLIEEIEYKGLMLSQFDQGHSARNYNFVQRNEIVVDLSEAIIITQADTNSGSMRSAEFALKKGKKLYVLPHRIGESDGTNLLLKNGLANAIYDIDEFVLQYSQVLTSDTKDEFLEFCKTNPTYDEVVEKFSSKVFEYELLGKIEVKNGLVYCK